MRYRSYGRLSMKVSEIGFGAWQLGNQMDWTPMSDSDAIHLVNTAYEQGCNFFDTAPGYGRGNSERLLGEALVGFRDKVVINTKVGHTAEGQADFSQDGIRKSVESSLKRLQTNFLDSVLLHNPPREFLRGDSPQMLTLQRLQDEGMIHAYGASVDSAQDMFTVLQTSGSSILEVLFNIFHQETEIAFAQAEKQSVGLIIKVPLDSGWLSGRHNATSRFSGVRNRWNEEVIKRRAALVEQIRYVEDDDTTMTQAALRFILAHSAVSTVIPGSKNIAQWKENASASERDMPQEMVKGLHNFWDVNVRNDPLPW